MKKVSPFRPNTGRVAFFAARHNHTHPLSSVTAESRSSPAHFMHPENSTRPDRKKPQPPPAPASRGTQPSPSWRHLWPSIGTHVLIGCATVACLTIAKIAFEQTRAGRVLDQWLYAQIQYLWFTLPPAEVPLPISIVDISDLHPQAPANPGEVSHDAQWAITPRKPLTALVEAIAKEGPYSIGLDLDLGPRGNPPAITTEDRELLEACGRIANTYRSADGTRPVNIAVAIGERSQFISEVAWLGDANYYELAGTASLFPDEFRCLPLVLRHDVQQIQIPSLSALMAQSAGAQLPSLEDPGSFLESLRLLHPGSRHLDWTAHCYFVEYTALPRFRDSLIEGFEPAIIARAREKIKNNIVFIGAVRRAHDMLVWPQISTRPVPGVMAHACGALTLLRGPIRVPSHGARILIDVGLTLSIMLTVVLLRLLYFKARKKDILDMHRASRILRVFVIVVVLTLAIWWAIVMRVIWTDAPLVAIAFAIEENVDHRFRKAFQWMVATWNTTVLKA